MINFDIDFVFPYVNGADPEWAAQHAQMAKKYNRNEDGTAERYADFGFLRYMLRSLAENMPWLHKVFIIVERPSQVPAWLNTEKVQVVYHYNIMPNEILPTYNSSTIEMFLHRIPGLAEHFIYGNDDMYCLKPLQPTDFFTEDGRLRMKFKTYYRANATTLFRKMCMHEYDSVCRLTANAPDSATYQRPSHDYSPMLLSDVKTVRHALKDKIEAHLEPFRASTQHQQYIYLYYSLFNGRTVPSERKFIYTSTAHSPYEVYLKISEQDPDCLCINDEQSSWRQYWFGPNEIRELFKAMFPNPSKYEII